jgi:hypothetical protein
LEGKGFSQHFVYSLQNIESGAHWSADIRFVFGVDQMTANPTRNVMSIHRPERFCLRGFVVCFALFLLFEGNSAERKPIPREGFVAAFLSRLPRYVNWPKGHLEPTNGRFKLVMLGEDPTGGLTEKMLIQSKSAGRDVGVDIVVVDTIDNIPACQLLFVPSEQQEYWNQNRDMFMVPNCLVVSETNTPEKSKDVVSFSSDDRRVHVFLDNAREAQLKISSKLLRICEVHR